MLEMCCFRLWTLIVGIEVNVKRDFGNFVGLKKFFEVIYNVELFIFFFSKEVE